MGFCLGGLMTFLTAARHHPDAAVAYHGGDTEKYLSEARGISAHLLMHLAEEDEFINKDAQARSPMVKAPAFAFGRWGCALRIDAVTAGHVKCALSSAGLVRPRHAPAIGRDRIGGAR